MWLLMFLLLCFSVLSTHVWAEEAADATQYVVHADTLWDGTKPDVIPNGEVWVDHGRIRAVGQHLAVPATVRRLVLPHGATLLPGLIDCHTHLLSNIPDFDSYGSVLLNHSQAYRTLEGAAHARRTLLAGFTTVRDLGTEGAGYADVALRDAIRAGLVDGPRMVVATRAIAAVGGYQPLHVSPDQAHFPDRDAVIQTVNGVDEARRAVREQVAHGADVIKLYADFSDSTEDFYRLKFRPGLTQAEMRTIVEEAHRAGRKVAAHAISDRAIRDAVLAGVDSIEHGWLASESTLQLMKQHSVVLVPTVGLYVAGLQSKDPTEQAACQRIVARLRPLIRQALALGIPLASGFDPYNSAVHGQNAQELTGLVALGLTPYQALTAATRDAARLLGLDHEIGQLKPGYAADMIAVRGNPLTDIQAITHIMWVKKGINH